MLLDKSNSLNEIIKVIKAAHKITILSHESPDPDAYGSSLALTLGLRSIGKEVDCYNKDGIVADLSFLPMISEVKTGDLPEGSDLYITTDSAAFKRTSNEYERFLSAQENTLNIDHHISNHFDAKYNYVEKRASASEIIFDILESLDIKLTEQMAELMLAGIYTDTGSLQFPGVEAKTFMTVAKLVETGVTPAAISQKLFQEKPLNLLKLTARLIDNLEIKFNGAYALVEVKPEWMEELGLDYSCLNYLKNFFRNIEGVKISVLLRSEKDIWKGSLRSEEPYDVNLVANQLGGGGHAQAAGLKWSGEITDLKSRLDQLVEAEINRHGQQQ